jgi:hypothetical protein
VPQPTAPPAACPSIISIIVVDEMAPSPYIDYAKRKERIRNVAIRQQIGLEETAIKETENNQLTWYGHVQRMAEERLPKMVLK